MVAFALDAEIVHAVIQHDTRTRNHDPRRKELTNSRGKGAYYAVLIRSCDVRRSVIDCWRRAIVRNVRQDLRKVEFRRMGLIPHLGCSSPACLFCDQGSLHFVHARNERRVAK